MTSVFAAQNDFALRYGHTASPTSFLALRLRGLQKNQPDLVSAFASSSSLPSSAGFGSSQGGGPVMRTNSYGNNNNNVNANPLRASVAASSIHPPSSGNTSHYNTSQQSYQQHNSHLGGFGQQQQQQHQQYGYGNRSSSSQASHGGGGGYNNGSVQQQQLTQSQQWRSPSRQQHLRTTSSHGGHQQQQRQQSPPDNGPLDVDAQVLPAYGALSAAETLAKALSSDPDAYASPSAQPAMAECHVCHRRFDATRLSRHVAACQKSAAAAAKRKEFDAQEARVNKLYENDPMAAAKVLRQIEKEEELAAMGRAPPKKSTWRKKSAELINAVGRAAVSGSAPPIPVADDRVPCPGCGKKFSEETAQRHIPSCLERQRRSSFR